MCYNREGVFTSLLLKFQTLPNISIVFLAPSNSLKEITLSDYQKIFHCLHIVLPHEITGCNGANLASHSEHSFKLKK